MTRLYVDIICARCGEAYGVSNEIRYDKDGIPIDIVEGLCLNCRCEELLIAFSGLPGGGDGGKG